MRIDTPADLNSFHTGFYAELQAQEARRLGLAIAIVARTSDSVIPVAAEQPAVFVGEFRHHGEIIVRLSEREIQHG